MTEEALLKDRPILILREPKTPPPPKHICTPSHGDDANKSDHGSIVQCECGKRYRCRESYSYHNSYVWVRRILPWPPRQKDWPRSDA